MVQEKSGNPAAISQMADSFDGIIRKSGVNVTFLIYFP
jgi:hypothetical protein